MKQVTKEEREETGIHCGLGLKEKATHTFIG